MENGRKSLSGVRFGPFEADVRAGELLKSGVKIKLQEQPFQILAALLERPGQVITRDELRQRVWPADTFVDFERGLNKAINRLREALGDSAENSTFVETLPRRGYRFIASVERSVRSLAVLPLENLSGSPNQEHWADGLTDELITHVAKIVNLRVISRTSVMRFKHTGKALAEIARDLGVEAVVQGSVAVSDRKVRIGVQLIEPFSEEHLWAESYERDLGDVVTLQAQIAQAIARQISARLTPEEDARSAAGRRVNPEAYEAYLKGRFFWNKRTAVGLEKSLEYFNKAVVLDPDYAAAYAGLADSHIILGLFSLRPPREVYPKARALAEKALQLDDTLAEGHKSIGHIRDVYDWDWAGSEKEFRRALELDPNCAIAHQWYSTLLITLRRPEEAVAEVLLARDLDPLSLVINAFVGFIYRKTRQYDRAVEACRKAVELDWNNPFAHWLLARCLDAAGERREALAESELAARFSGNRSPYTSHLGYALARVGDRAGACNVLRELTERANRGYVSPYDFATIYIGLDERDLAFEWLEKACHERTPRLAGDIQDPIIDGLRTDPRFSHLVRQIGVPE